MKYRLVLPSAKLIAEEQQYIGKLPPLIYPINDRIVFDYLYEKYQDIVSDFVITCYEQKERLIHSIEKYGYHNIHIVELEELSDLGHSIYAAIKGSDVPIIINFADTIILDPISEIPEDSIFYTLELPSDIWAFFEEEGGRIEKIYEKRSIDSVQKMKLFIGVFSISDTPLFCRCLSESFQNKKREGGLSSFYEALQTYSSIKCMKTIEVSEWLDVGHADKYVSSNLAVKERVFNHIVIDKKRAILRKTSENKEKLIGEILWYLKLPMEVEYVRPRIFSYSVSYENPYVEMEYYAYHTLHEVWLYGELSKKQWYCIMEQLHFICTDFSRYTARTENIKFCLECMYLKKTIQRLTELEQEPEFSAFFSSPVTVNGNTYVSLNKICDLLQKEIPKRLYGKEEFTIIHGDLCFSNIMIDSNFMFIKLVDPRGEFGYQGIYGDDRYEYAKLMHCIDGKYDYIIKDLFAVNADIAHTALDYTIFDKKRDYDLVDIFKDVFRTELTNEYENIILIEALLFLSMIPLHRENLSHQYAMLGIGLDVLSKIIDISMEGEEKHV